MEAQVLTFLSSNHVCTLTTLLKDGSPHAAAIHYSHQNNPLELYFSTENTSRKCEAVMQGTVKGAVVVGFSEQEWITLQLDGEVSLVTDPQELVRVQGIHYAKNPNSAKFKDDPATVFLKFVPKWWRYTDFNTDPVTYLGSK